jgi:hypothetical protein
MDRFIMDRFIRAQNVQRFRSLLERATEEADREKLLSLLAEEEQKQKDDGDSLRPKVSHRFRLSDQRLLLFG